MKKFLTFLMLMVLLVPNALRADELTIGTGTNSTNNAPFANYYSNSWVEAIYPASEIGESGLITSISYYNVSQGYSLYTTDLRFYLAETSKNTHASTSDWTPLADLELVYEHSGVTLGGDAGWQKFVLDVPYMYEGKENLVVVIAKKANGYSSMQWQYTPTPNTCLVRRSDMSPDNFANHPGTQTNYTWVTDFRSNIKLDFTPKPVNCYKVLAINVENVTKNTATISWTPSEGQTSWDVYATTGAAPDESTTPTATGLTETTYTFTNLAPGVNNKLYVRGCNENGVSKWKSVTALTDPDFTGSGTEEDPYHIYSKNDLKMLADGMVAGFNTKGKYFKQMADIETITFTIGTGAKYYFRGTYDGNGYSVDVNYYNNYNQGFFESVGNGAVIKNLTITGKVETRYWQAGGIVAYVDLSAVAPIEGSQHVVIENCVNKATIKAGDNNAGGMISDFNSNGTDYLYIINCVNYGTINTVSTSSYAGGIAGRLQKDAIVKGCVNYGEINGKSYSGGVVAYPRTNVHILDCFNVGNVNGSGERLGGISGYSSGGSIYNCYNLGTVTGNNYMGGIIGRLKEGSVINAYNAGAVVSSSSNTETTGAAIGFNEGNAPVSNVYYLEGVYGNAYGSTCNAELISDVVSFTQDAENLYEYELATAVNGTTDLVEALNSTETYGENQWFEDIHGNNKYYPTFVVGNPPGLEFQPAVLAMGPRPIGQAMHPEVLKLTNTGSMPIEVTLIDLDNYSFFNFVELPELPLTLEGGKSIELEIVTNPEASISEGEISTNIAALWNNTERSAALGQITATAYVPTTPDVVATAEVVTGFPFTATQSKEGIYHNYELPGNNPNANDAVYELNITEDVLFNAEVVGQNTKVAVYTEDMYGEAYPSVDNNYTGPRVENVSEMKFFYFDQSQMLTHPGAAYNGCDASCVPDELEYLGANIEYPTYWLADDFSSEEPITINEMEFYAFQYSFSLESTFTGLYIQIYDGNPKEGGQVIWGTTTDNLMSYTEWTGLYRVYSFQFEASGRPIMRVVASDLDINLPAGEYWVAASMTAPAATGGLPQGLWGIPVTKWGETSTGNAIQKIETGEWINYEDSGYSLGLSMLLREGTSIKSRTRASQNPEMGVASKELYAGLTAEEKEVRSNSRSVRSSGGDNAIADMVMTPGKYYLVASSTSDEFTVNASTAAIPAPEKAALVYPAYQEKNVTAPAVLRWKLGNYTTEYQLVVGTDFPPTEVVVDWTSDLAEGYQMIDLYNNTNYFWQVNLRNTTGTTAGDVWAFTTTINPPQKLQIADSRLYPGEKAVLSWEGVSDRSHRGYNVYQDDVKVNKGPIAETTYSVSGLEYNQEGYNFKVSAIYDEGESTFTNVVKAYMTGNGTVKGYTYEQDGVTPVPATKVKFEGKDEYNNNVTASFTSDANGYYEGELLAGTYSAYTERAEYQEAQANEIVVVYDQVTEGVNFNMYEIYYPVFQVAAEEVDESNVNVVWSWNAIEEEVPAYEGWINYDDGEYVSSIGTGQPAPCYWAVSFPNTELYERSTLSKVAVFDAGASYAGTYTANIYLGGTTAPETLVSTQSVQLTGTGEMVEFDLSTPVTLDGTQPLWITFYTADVTYPAAGCTYVGDSNSDWISLDGQAWDHAAADYNLNYTWMIRGLLTNAKGQRMVLSHENHKPQFKGGVSTGTFVADASAQAKSVGLPTYEAETEMTRELKSYKVYRYNYFSGEYTEETVELLASDIVDTAYVDANWGSMEDGVYKWGVAAVYEGNRRSIENNAKPFVPEAGFVANATDAIQYNGEIVTGNFDASMVRGDLAYANVAYALNMPAGYVGFDLDNPVGATVIASSIINRGGEYYDGTFYGYSSDNYFHKVDPVTGAVIESNAVATAMTEMAYDYSRNTMYGIASGVLYTINLEDGSATSVGDLGQTVMAFGINLEGEAYGVVISTGDFYSIDVETATATLVGSTGKGCNYVQCGGFNHYDGTFYWFQCYSTSDMNLYTIDVTTGATSLVAANVGEITSWFVPYEVSGGNQYVGEVYPFQAANESPIIWSNMIDKNMTTQVDIAITTNSTDTPEGTVVKFVNMTEPEMGYDYEVVLDETGLYTIDGFRKGSYQLTIMKPGYLSCASGEIIDIWSATTIECQLEEIIASVSGLYVSPTGWAMWKNNLGYLGAEFAYDFEDGFEGWTTIDADGDGHNWYHSSTSYEHSATPRPSHSGTGHLTSESYCFVEEVLYPDNYVVAPEKVAIGSNSVFSFWASAQDAAWALEHFGVAVSTGDGTTAEEFTTIAEMDMTAKGNQKDAPRGSREDGYGTWYFYTVDLSEYAGQSLYIAIRHFNSSNQFFLCVDDVALTNGDPERGTTAVENFTVLLNGYEEAQVSTPYYQHENLIIGELYTTTVIANYAGGSSEPMSYTWTAVKCDNFEGPKEFTAEYENGNAVLNWELPGAAPEVDGETFTFGFESDLEGWTTIDGNGDSHIWYHSSESEAYHNVLPSEPHTGVGYVGSESFCNALGALYPDDYLVAPQKYAVSNGAKISFYACSKDNEWASEHFGVAVSTAGNTSASDFTTIAEWTMTGKSSKSAARGRGEQGNWYQYTADLSEYAGQEIYVAIRHFNCTDMFVLMVDDVEITTAAAKADLAKEEGTWMYYDDGNYYDGVGGPASFQWGIKLRAADVAQYAPAGLSKVAIYDRLATSGNFHIYLGGDNAPGTLAHTQSYTLTSSSDFVEIELTEAVAVDGTQNVWVVFETNDGANFPASCTQDTGDADGRWISIDGTTWEDVTSYGLNDTWMIRAFLSEAENPGNELACLGAMLYRDGELITPEPIAATSFTEPLAEFGEYEYSLRVVYDGPKDTTYYAMSCPETVTLVRPCDAPENLYGEQATENGQTGVSLVWPYSAPMSEWLYYDDGANVDGIGGPASFYWGVMFPSSALGGYDGTMITKVSMFDYAASSGVINVYYGGSSSPETLVHTQNYTSNGTGSFVEFELTSALPVDITQNIWIIFSTTTGTNYPAAASADCGDPNSRWISMDGVVWEDVASYGLNYTWMVRAYVSNEVKGEVSQLAPITDFEYTTGEGEIKANGNARNRNLDHYNIYRGTNADNFELIAESNEGKYFDAVETGTYYYQVTAVYSFDGEECESEPATAYGNADQNYVVVEVVSIDENGVSGMMIYPNPTKDNLTITAEAMTRITITNALGQTIYDQEIDTDNKVIDMAQYEAGVYMVHITTENGVAVERVTVVK